MVWQATVGIDNEEDISSEFQKLKWVLKKTEYGNTKLIKIQGQ